MVDAQKGLAQPKGQTLGKGHTHQQAAQQTRAPRHGNHIYLRCRFAATLHKLVEQRADKAIVLTRGKFRHHAAEQGVQICLAGKHGLHKAAILNQRQRGFITRTFNTETQHALREGKRLGRQSALFVKIYGSRRADIGVPQSLGGLPDVLGGLVRAAPRHKRCGKRQQKEITHIWFQHSVLPH